MKPNSSELERKGNALAHRAKEVSGGCTPMAQSLPCITITPSTHLPASHKSPLSSSSTDGKIPVESGSQPGNSTSHEEEEHPFPSPGRMPMGPDWPCTQHSSPGAQSASKKRRMEERVLQTKTVATTSCTWQLFSNMETSSLHQNRVHML